MVAEGVTITRAGETVVARQATSLARAVTSVDNLGIKVATATELVLQYFVMPLGVALTVLPASFARSHSHFSMSALQPQAREGQSRRKSLPQIAAAAANPVEYSATNVAKPVI